MKRYIYKMWGEYRLGTYCTSFYRCTLFKLCAVWHLWGNLTFTVWFFAETTLLFFFVLFICWFVHEDDVLLEMWGTLTWVVLSLAIGCVWNKSVFHICYKNKATTSFQMPVFWLLFLLCSVTWLPPMPWQLKMPTFSFSFRAMLSRHWLVSTFRIWVKSKHAKVNNEHCNAHWTVV